MENIEELPVKYAPYNRKKQFLMSQRAKLTARSLGRMTAKQYKAMFEYAAKRGKTRGKTARKTPGARQSRAVAATAVRKSTRSVKAPVRYSPPKIASAATGSTRKGTVRRMTKKQEANLSDLFSGIKF